jgi:hypothetical protein
MVIGMVIGAKIGAGALKGSFFAKFQAATDMEQAERLYQTASSLASQAAEPFLSSCLHTLTFMLIEQPLAEIAGKVLLHVAGAFLPLPRPQDLSQNFWMQFSMLTVQVYNIVAEQIAIHRSEAAANRGENSIEEPQTEDLPSNSYQEEECSREADYQHTGQSNTVELQGIIDTQESNALQKATEINNYDIFDSFQSHLKNAEIAKFPPGTDSAQVIQLYGQELQNSGGISPENPESKSQFSITNIARDLNQKLYDEKVMDPSQYAHFDLENPNNGNHYDVCPVDASTCDEYQIIDMNTGQEVASLSREEVEQCKATIIDPKKEQFSPPDTIPTHDENLIPIDRYSESLIDHIDFLGHNVNALDYFNEIEGTKLEITAIGQKGIDDPTRNECPYCCWLETMHLFANLDPNGESKINLILNSMHSSDFIGQRPTFEEIRDSPESLYDRFNKQADPSIIADYYNQVYTEEWTYNRDIQINLLKDNLEQNKVIWVSTNNYHDLYTGEGINPKEEYNLVILQYNAEKMQYLVYDPDAQFCTGQTGQFEWVQESYLNPLIYWSATIK